MKPLHKLLVVALVAALVPFHVSACATCSGQSDSPLASGMNWGIFTLLGVVLTVLTCFALFFVHVVRGEKAQIDQEAAARGVDPKNPSDV